MATHPYLLIDAFTAQPFSGNPAAVVLLAGAQWPDDAWMKGVASEFNVPETAFVLSAPGFIHQRIPAPPVLVQPFGLRWFTPQLEVALCGHATLATVRALREQNLVQDGQQLGFDTRSGRLTCSVESGLIRMDFPARQVEACEAPEGLFEALGLKAPAPVYRDEDYLVIELGDENAVRTLAPRFSALFRIPFHGVCVTAAADAGNGADMVSRFFAPRMGVDEDPVTGSAHCRLGPFWAARLGKAKLLGRQLSARGGEMGVEVNGERVWLSGTTALVAKGELQV